MLQRRKSWLHLAVLAAAALRCRRWAGGVIHPPFFTAMELSAYHKIFRDASMGASVALFSAKNASTIVIPESMLAEISEGTVSEKEREILSDLGFLVESSQKEKGEIHCLIDELNEVDTVFAAKVVMNLDCNLACRYCFEGQRKGKLYMTEETAERVVNFVRERVIARQDIEEVRLTFYGGEPLLSPGLLEYISEEVRTFCNHKKYSYKGFIVTNGTLLTRSNAERLCSVGVQEAAVTIDGPKDINDRFRPFRTGRGSFDVIMRNIKESCAVMDIELGGNFTRENYQLFPLLLDYLAEEGVTPDKLLRVRFDAVTREAEGMGPRDFQDGCGSYNEPWLFAAVPYLRDEILKRGYRTHRVAPRLCLLEVGERFVINYEGSVYKCPGLIGRDEFKVGDLMTGIRDYRGSHGLDNWKKEECTNCAYLPLCFGGCRYMKLVRDGNIDGVDCRKQYFDDTLEQLVKQDIRYGLSAETC